MQAREERFQRHVLFQRGELRRIVNREDRIAAHERRDAVERVGDCVMPRECDDEPAEHRSGDGGELRGGAAPCNGVVELLDWQHGGEHRLPRGREERRGDALGEEQEKHQRDIRLGEVGVRLAEERRRAAKEFVAER